MSNKSKGGGPKTDKGKVISSRNSITHGLTAKNWINDGEQDLFNTTVKALNQDFNPQTHVEEMLIAKLAECTVRLTRIQNVESSMFDLASSEAIHPDLSINSLSNNNDELSRSVKEASPLKLQFNADKFNEARNLLNEIKSQNFDDITDWNYIENNMQLTAKHIVNECLDNNMGLDEFIAEESSRQSNVMKVIFVGAKDKEVESTNGSTLTASEITKKSENIRTSDLREYLDNLSQSLAKDLQVQTVLKNLDVRIQQVKNSAIPDPQKPSLVQRYRTANERQFSKTLGELFEVQKRRNSG